MTDITIDRDWAFFIVGVLEAVSWEKEGKAKELLQKAVDHIRERSAAADAANLVTVTRP